ncbi:hypothetical protein RB653_006579 [Dictyostelium firmibasis]|uniref:PA14 domain-containing protein n=1 Tax=Dictyostelium firmibasis TaxID=79012 RepID=A0AAN7YN88_9MYCE
MKIIISLLLNIFLINYVWGQPFDDGRLRPIPQEIVVRNFKPDRSVDFGIPLSADFVKGIMQPTLGADKRPKYCCGENSVIDDAGILIVNNEQSFNQWFDSDDVCSSYLLNHRLSLDVWDNLNIIGGGGLFTPAEGVGFGDPSLFPEYQSDPFNQYQCFELHLSYIPLDESTDFFSFSITGEIWIYFNNTLVIDQAGDTDGYGGSANFYPREVPGVVYNDENYVYPIDLYSCVRSIDTDPEGPLTIMGSGNFFCSWIDDGGACNGLNFMAPCVDDTTKCFEIQEVCGNCVKDIPRVCQGPDTFCTGPVCLEGYGCIVENKTVCDDPNPCTIDSCDEILGCSHIVIPNCYCNTTTCFSNDLCFPKVCSGDDCITIPIDCEVEQPDCPTSVCINGVCSTCPVESSSSEDISTTGSEVTTIGPVTTTGVSISTIGAVSTTDISISTIGIVTTTGETISTIGVVTTTGFTTTTTTTGASTTFSSTTSTTTPQTTSTISTGTRPPVNHAKCEHDSCPFKYHCYQLKHAYTCVSKEFNDKCEPERLVLFY